jgi:dTDP-glucose 4,6-dehydratase
MARRTKLLVTGAAGFIGSEFVRQAVCREYAVAVVDKLSYAGDVQRLSEAGKACSFFRADICSARAIEKIFKKEKPEIILHFAAETHVDRSILSSEAFIRTNVLGTQVLLDAARKSGIRKFIHISTDEVYGDIPTGQFYEHTPFNPSSPYSSSKAAADLLVRSYVRTFGFPAVILRPSNNYGPWQYPEKFIPMVIYKALKNEKIPVFAKGLNVREWLYVSDCARAIMRSVQKARPGEVYNVGSGNERKNIEVARNILDILGKPYSLIEFVADRPGHDFRYSLNFTGIKRDLGWNPEISFEEGLLKTVNWYVKHENWLERKVFYLREYWKKVYKKGVRRSPK